MRKGSGSAYDKWNISVDIWDTDIPTVNQVIVATAKHTSGAGTATLPEHLSSLPVFSGDRVTGTLLKTCGELMCSGRISYSCSTSDAIILFMSYSDAVFVIL
jgi:hypothetical protein